MKILVHFPFEPQQIDALRQLAVQHGHELFHATDEAAALQVAPQIEVLLGSFLPSVCAAAPHLRWIQSFSAGMDSFLFPAIVAREEVVITNMAGLYASQGGEHAWALLLALCRGLHRAVRTQDQQRWQGGPVVELTGSTIGIIGMGGFWTGDPQAGPRVRSGGAGPRSSAPGKTRGRGRVEAAYQRKSARTDQTLRRGNARMSAHPGDLSPHRAGGISVYETLGLSGQCHPRRHHR